MNEPDPFGGSPENWSPDPETRFVECPLCGAVHVRDPWPPTDPVQLAALNAWMDEQEEIALTPHRS